MTKTDILILGAGIGGYETFRTLAKLLKRHRLKKIITIIDRNNYFTFTPMLHEAAAGAVEPQHCAIPLRELTEKTPHRFIKAEIKGIDPSKKQVQTSAGTIGYDTCVVALGSAINFFNIPGAEQYAHNVRTLRSALRLHDAFIALLETSPAANLNLIIVGGGFTGVEVAGQLADFIKKDIALLYPDITVKIHLIESGSILAKSMPHKVHKKIAARLKAMSVTVHLRSRVQAVKKEAIQLENGKEIKSDLTIWTSGFKNFAQCYLPQQYCEAGRIPVTSYLCHEKDNSLFAIGDIMLRREPGSEIPYPQLAEAAHKEGMYIAKAIVRRAKSQKIKPFVFRPTGTLMPIGNWYGVLTIGKFCLFGPLAWWIRRTVYLLFIPGILRKLKIVTDWTLHCFGFHHTLLVESTGLEVIDITS